MSGISSWLMNIVGIVILSVLVDIILPDSKISKYVKSVFAFIILLIIIAPLKDIKGINFDLNEYFQNPNIEVDEDFINNINKMKVEKLSNNILILAENSGFYNLDVQIVSNNNESELQISKVNIFLENLVIDEKNKHIDKYRKIKDIVKTVVSVNEEMIEFYEWGGITR